MKRLFLFVFALLTVQLLPAQSLADYEKAYQEFKRRSMQQYDDFRDRANASYEKFMREAWTEFDTKQPEPVPSRPEPPKPVVKDPDKGPSNDVVPVDEVVVPPPAPVEPPQPAAPIPVPAKPQEPTFEFAYYGTACAVPLKPEHRFALRGVDENSVADGWAVLAGESYLPVISGALKLRSDLKLCDWAYVRMLEEMTDAFFGPGHENEARLMQMFLLTQSGYKVRIARAGNRLVLLLPSREIIYQFPYLTIDNVKYFIVERNLQSKSFMVFNREFPKERFFSLLMTEQPLLDEWLAEPRELTSKRWPELTASVAVNRNLVAFYNDYPLNDMWNYYALASLSARAKEQLYPALRDAIGGASKLEAANRLLNFVQTSLDYLTDDEQFGYERPFFPDETLFYPFCDCEDRAILYSVLVRDLLGLDVVLLHYPEHLAAAVAFDDDTLSGDYVTLEGRKYLVTDPTYIGASVGDAMPQFKKTAARIVRID